MLNNKGNTSFRGDVGLFRAALLLSGFFTRSECSIFNDNSKNGTRRLKLWFADAVFNAKQEQQRALEGFLREAFGDRISAMYFSVASHPGGRCAGFKSLCIRLKD